MQEPILKRRKRLIVERKFQFRFARFVILLAFVSSVLTGLVVFYTTFTMLGERLADVYPQGRLVEIFRSVHLALFINVMVLLPILFYGSVKYSHRIAGPLPKMYEALRQIGEGNFEVNLVLRKNDELRDLADLINSTARLLKERESRK
jgi:ABC-type transport system involved in cytochrome c biogenesis permease subunit